MPEGPEVKRVADVISQAKGIAFRGVATHENVQGKVHRYTKEPPENLDWIQRRFIIEDVQTFGKLIAIRINVPNAPIQDVFALNTLGMSGTWAFDQQQHKHARLSFVAEECCLTFIDPRCFGTVRIKPFLDPYTKNIGPDLLNPKEGDLDKWMKVRTGYYAPAPVAAVLLNQKLIAGIGNIYRAEILWQLGINPWDMPAAIKEDRWRAIYDVGRAILASAYASGGTTIHTFDAGGVTGQFKPQVYGKTECARCHGRIRREEMRGRSIFWCEVCQPLCDYLKRLEELDKQEEALYGSESE